MQHLTNLAVGLGLAGLAMAGAGAEAATYNLSGTFSDDEHFSGTFDSAGLAPSPMSMSPLPGRVSL